jgi:hypothetical protein
MSYFSWVFVLTDKLDTSITLAAFLNQVDIQFAKKINQIGSVNSGEYIKNKFKAFFLTSGLIHELTPSYSPESNGIAERFNLTMNIIACSTTIVSPDFHCLWAESINMGAYLKNRLPHKLLPSATIPLESF